MDAASAGWLVMVFIGIGIGLVVMTILQINARTHVDTMQAYVAFEARRLQQEIDEGALKVLQQERCSHEKWATHMITVGGVHRVDFEMCMQCGKMRKPEEEVRHEQARKVRVIHVQKGGTS